MCIPNDLLNKKTNPYLVESVTKYLTFTVNEDEGTEKADCKKGKR